MQSASDLIAQVSQLAAGQWGMLTTAQAEREGISRLRLARLADSGVLERVDRGVYATTSAVVDHRALRAAWLALDPARTAEERLVDPVAAGVVSHTSAAGLHQLGDLVDDLPEITLPHRKQTRRNIRLHHRSLSGGDVTLVEGLPTTTEERTVADLLRDGHDLEHVAQIVEQGYRRGLVDLDVLATQVDPSAPIHGQPTGSALVEHLLDLVGLSSAALARDLVNSPAGRELLAAGRASALDQALASVLPTLDPAEITGLRALASSVRALLAGVDVSKLTGLDQLLRSIQLPNPVTQPLDGVRLTPAAQSAIARIQAPDLQAVLASTHPHRLSSPSDRTSSAGVPLGEEGAPSSARGVGLASDEPERRR